MEDLAPAFGPVIPSVGRHRVRRGDSVMLGNRNAIATIAVDVGKREFDIDLPRNVAEPTYGHEPGIIWMHPDSVVGEYYFLGSLASSLYVSKQI